jgi:hypothetical protein
LDGILSGAGFLPLTPKEDGDACVNGDLLSALFSWWPFVMLIAAWIVIVRFNRPRTASGITMIELYEQQSPKRGA